MEPRYLLDTDICIYIRKGRPEQVVRRFRTVRPGEAALSVITYGELLYGAGKNELREQSLARLRQLVELVPALPLPEKAAEIYGFIRAELERRGELISNNDLWIAARARAEGAELGSVYTAPAGHSCSLGFGWNQATPPKGLWLAKSGMGGKWPLGMSEICCIQRGITRSPISGQRQTRCPVSSFHKAGMASLHSHAVLNALCGGGTGFSEMGFSFASFSSNCSILRCSLGRGGLVFINMSFPRRSRRGQAPFRRDLRLLNNTASLFSLQHAMPLHWRFSTFRNERRPARTGCRWRESAILPGGE